MYSAVQILDVLKAKGYQGDRQLVNINKFLTDNNLPENEITFPADETAEEETVDLKEIFGKKTISFDRSNSIKHIISTGSAPAGIVKGKRAEILKKSYQSRAEKGLTRFHDADEAEYMSASFRLAIHGERDYSQKSMDRDIWTKGQTTYINTTGGVLTDPQILGGLLYVTEPTGAARRLANVVNMTSDLANVKRKTGIITMSHRLDSASYAASENTYDVVNLSARDVGCIDNMPQNLIDDAAISVVDDIAASAVEALQRREDADYIAGDGAATYGNQRGLIAALPSGAYLDAAGNTWASITDANILTMIGSVENVDLGRCAFLCSRQFYVQVLSKLAQAKSGTSPSDVSAGTVVNGIKANATYQGFPVVFEQRNMPTVTAVSTKSVYFGDFMGASMLGVRKYLEVATSTHSSFSTGGVDVRMSARSCVNIHGDGKATTYGPVVCLTTTS